MILERAMHDDYTTHAPQREDIPEDIPRAYVALLDGKSPAVIDLPLGCPVSIGRSHSSAIRIDSPSVSRLHATLQWDGDPTITLVERGSRNGTLVNGQRVSGRSMLRSGAEVAVGDAKMIVVVRGASLPQEEATSGERGLIAKDAAMLGTIAVAERAARTNTTVLLVGETGVGKEVVARHIHRSSKRHRAPFVAVNCGAIAETLAESTLFGHEKGAFTGATSQQKGTFEQAEGGTLLLDEVGELSPSMQVRLLRVLQEREIIRVGSTSPIQLDVRLIAATNANLTERTEQGTFRQDLLYRLDVMRVEILPLRKRPDDVLPLALHFLKEFNPEPFELELARGAVDALRRHRWPGNVRELRNVIERAVALRESGVIEASDLADLGRSGGFSDAGTLHTHVGDAERQAIVDALEACDGNQTRAAQRLGISRRSIIYKMERHGLKRPPAHRK